MIREQLRPARPLRWVAVPALVVVVVTLAVLARLAGADPGVRLRDDLEQAGYEGVEVRLSAAEPADTALVEVRYRSGLGEQGRQDERDVLLRLVWERYDGRLGAVRPRPDEVPGELVTAAELESRFGARPADRSDAGYPAGVASVGLITVLALVAVLATGVLVVCAVLAAILITRRGRRRPRPES